MVDGQTSSRYGQYLLASAVSALLTILGTAPRAEAGVMVLWLDVAEENAATAEEVDTSSVATDAANDGFDFPLPPAIEDEGCEELETFEIAPAFEAEKVTHNELNADEIEVTADEVDIPLPPPVPAEAAQVEDAQSDEIVDADIFDTAIPEPPAIPSFAVDASEEDIQDLAQVEEADDDAADETVDETVDESVQAEKLSTIERFNNCREVMESPELEPAAVASEAVVTAETEEDSITIDEVTRQAIADTIDSLIERAEVLQQKIADVVADTNQQRAGQPVAADADVADAVEDVTTIDPQDVIYNAQEAEVSDTYANDAGTYEHGEYEVEDDYDYDYGYDYYSDDYSYEDEYGYNEADNGAETDVESTVADEAVIDAEVTTVDTAEADDAVQVEESECPFVKESECPYADESECPFTEEYYDGAADTYEADDSSDGEYSDDPEYDYSYDADYYEYYGDAYDASDEEVVGAESEDQVEEEVQTDVDSAAAEFESTRDAEADDPAEADGPAEADDATFDYESHYDYDNGYDYDYEFDAEYAD